jgi:hypothetical protein
MVLVQMAAQALSAELSCNSRAGHACLAETPPGAPPCLRAFGLFDVHALNEAVAQRVDVDYGSVGDRATVERAHDLVHVDGDTPVAAGRAAKRLDARIAN